MTVASLPVPSLTSVGSLESYIRAVSRFPMLSAEQEIEFGRKLKYDNDLEAAQQLILSHLRLVVSVARQYLGYGLPHADLIQEGNIGLMKAVRRFDPERGVRLVSFAVHWIRAEIHEHILRNWRLVKVATTKAQRKLFFNLRSLKTSLRALSAKETHAIAKQLGVKVEEVTEMEMRLQGQDIPLDPGPNEDESESFSPLAYLTDVDAEPSKELERKQLELRASDGLKQALGNLDPRSRRIIEARWLHEDDAKTLHELADELGVSAERVRQIEAKAIQKMRTALAASA